jgi:cytochrome P450
MGPRACVGEGMSTTVLALIAARVVRDTAWTLKGDAFARKYMPTSRPQRAVAGVFTPRGAGGVQP